MERDGTRWNAMERDGTRWKKVPVSGSYAGGRGGVKACERGEPTKTGAVMPQQVPAILLTFPAGKAE